jgi:hypothetical protein
VYVQTPKGVEPRPIKLGLDNNRMAHVLGGLEPGEQVLLDPPLQEAATSGEAGRPPEALPPATQPAAVGGDSARPMRSQPNGARMPGGDEAQPSGEGRRGGADGGGEGRQGRRSGGFGGDPNMTPEQREAARKEFLDRMTPEQRQQMEQRMRERGTGGGRRQRDGGEGAGAGGAGGAVPPRSSGPVNNRERQ